MSRKDKAIRDADGSRIERDRSEKVVCDAYAKNRPQDDARMWIEPEGESSEMYRQSSPKGARIQVEQSVDVLYGEPSDV